MRAYCHLLMSILDGMLAIMLIAGNLLLAVLVLTTACGRDFVPGSFEPYPNLIAANFTHNPSVRRDDGGGRTTATHRARSPNCTRGSTQR